jgi:5'-3' exonuclease
LEENNKKNYAIIDGDVVAYHACSDTVIKDDFGNKTYIPVKNAEEAFEKFKVLIDSLVEICFADDYLCSVKGQGNFRQDIFPEYKAHRNTGSVDKRKELVPDVRLMAIEAGIAVPAHNREADDYVRIWAEECRRNGDNFVICSIDKDLLCIPGKHYLIHKQQFVDVSEDQGNFFYWRQVLQGDATDNIQGIPGIGPKKAEKILVDCDTNEKREAAVVGAYKNYFKEEWYDRLLLNGKLIHIQKDINDYFSLDRSKYE